MTGPDVCSAQNTFLKNIRFPILIIMSGKERMKDILASKEEMSGSMPGLYNILAAFNDFLPLKGKQFCFKL